MYVHDTPLVDAFMKLGVYKAFVPFRFDIVVNVNKRGVLRP